MKAENFAYWLQGVFEVAKLKSLNEEQTECVKKHLALVFIHDIDPKAGDEKMQEALNAVHNDEPAFSTSGKIGGPTFRC